MLRGSEELPTHGRARLAGWLSLLLLVMLPRLAGAGVLRWVESLRDDDGLFGLAGVHGIDSSPDGHHVYAAAFVDHSLVVMSRDLATGGLRYVETHFDKVDGVDGLMSATSVRVSPDGNDVYVASYFADALATFRRDPASGRLAFHQVFHNENVAGLSAPRSVTVSPDGAYVYVATYYDDSLVVFRRDAASGALAHVQTLTHGVGGVYGMLRNSAVAVSPDAANVYVTSEGGDAVAIFARGPGADPLTFRAALRQGELGIADLTNPTSIAVSPDARFVYVLAKRAILTFRRDLFSGDLALLTSSRVGIATGDEDPAASSLTLNHEGSLAFVTLSQVDRVVAFARPAQSGRLGPVQTVENGGAGFEGIAGAHDAALSPDDSFLYVAAQFDDAVTTLAVDPGVCPSDCDADGRATIEELVRAVNVKVGTGGGQCPAVAANSDGAEAMLHLILSVDYALQGCVS